MTLDEQIEAVEFKISMARHISADIFILASLKELKAMKESHQSAFREAAEMVKQEYTSHKPDRFSFWMAYKLIEQLEAKAGEV